MRLSVCFSILVLAVALAKASPAANPAEKSSSMESAKIESQKEDLEIEDTGSDKDRTKKSASFCIDIKPGSFQPTQGPCKDNQQVVQNANIAVRSEPATQLIQGYNFVQPSYVQSMPQASIVLPQQTMGSYQFLQLVQSPSKPCAQSTPSNLQTEIVPQDSVDQPNSKSDPEEAPKEQPKPARIEDASEPLPVPQETLTILPAAPSYHEHLFALPSSSMAMYPKIEQVPLASLLQPSSMPLSNNILTPCSCQNNMATFSEAALEPMVVKTLPYLPAVARSPMMMPPNTKMHIVTHERGMSPMQSRHHHGHSHTHAHINVNAGAPQSLVAPTNVYSTRGLVDTSFASGISLSSYPTTYRASSPIIASSLRNAENTNNSPLAFEVNDLMQSAKMTREVDSSAKMEEVKQQADDNTMNIKEETKQN